MNAKGAAILVNPHPCGHIVYPYTDESLVGQAVALFASAGLRNDEGVILIMSSGHCESIKLRLQLEGISTGAYELLGRLTCIMAEDLLAEIVPDGTLDEVLFKSTIARFIKKARASVGNGHSGKVRVFGEMVSQLRNKDLNATTRLEQLWNEVIEEHSVSLLCTYALTGAEDHVPGALVDLHSQSIEREPTAV
jgi:MEDS: MEthanogen/methylotroph, DcmR Sensory domain